MTPASTVTIGTAFGKRMPVRVIDRQENLAGGLTLKDATSVAAGIGPVCGKRV
jgi:hypothetical protein